MDISALILGGGLLAIGLTVFAESGLLVGFFLPGDTLLFGAGILAYQGVLPLPLLIVVVVVAAIAGDSTGYAIGNKFGPRLFRKKDGLIFKQQYLRQAELFYEKHGGKTIIIARFVPIVRTFAPVVAGIGNMPYHKFLPYNIIGGLLWGVSLPLLGYFVGSQIPGVEHYIEPVLLAVIALSLGPALYHLFREEKFREAIKLKLKHIFNRK